jgi:serine phosphatase RsbU (regulator of sigma subunit)/tetratricopeptide (TPR) repeat protein
MGVMQLVLYFIKKQLNIFRLLFVFSFVFTFFSANANEDSLIIVLKQGLAKSKTIHEKAELYYQLSENYGFKYADSSLIYAEKLVALYKPALDTDTIIIRLIAKGYNNIGVLNQFKGKPENTINYLIKASEMLEILKDNSSLVETYNNLAIIFQSFGNFNKSLEYKHKAIRTAEQINDFEQLIRAYSGLGSLHNDLEEYQKAIDIYNHCLKLIEEHKVDKLKPTIYSNLAIVMRELNDDKQALDYFLKAYKLVEGKNDPIVESTVLANIGSMYQKKADFETAIQYLLKSTEIRINYNMRRDLVSSYNNIARLYNSIDEANGTKKYDDSILFYGAKSFELAQKMNVPKEVMQSSELLYRFYKKKGDVINAFRYLEVYSQMALLDKEKSLKRDLYKSQYEFEFRQKAVQDSLKQVQDSEILTLKHNQEINNQRKNTLMSLIALTASLAIGVLIFIANRRTKQKNAQLLEKNQIITNQKVSLEEKNKEITDSITYAKRIQNAILPPNKIVKEYLAQSFIIYMPKDIVAGDFYWLQTPISDSDKPSDSIIHFAAADCTGHGVPGAMVSVVCNNGLNRSVREYGLTNPGEILDKTRQLVIEEFEKSDDEVKDGMDISLCALQGKTLWWAGANNPLWIIRKNTEGVTELVEVKPNKQPIGKYADSEPFTTHKIELENDDLIYIFTDGYQDQFGGEKGKKFKASALKELLLSICQKSMDEQKTILINAFENWKGDLEQIDDVCLIGVRV